MMNPTEDKKAESIEKPEAELEKTSEETLEKGRDELRAETGKAGKPGAPAALKPKMSAADLIKNRAAAVKAAAPKNPAPKAAASNPKENIVSKPQTTEKPRSEDPSKNSEEERKRNNQMLSQEEAHEKLAQEMQQRNENLKREGELKKEEALQTDKPVQSGSDRLAPRVHVKPGSREKTPNETKKRHSTGKNGGVREPITLAELGVIAAKEQGIAPPKTYQLTPFETKAIGIKTPEMQGPNKNQ